MKTEFRNRAFLPVMMPLMILLVIAAVVGAVASVLLLVDRQGAIVIALLSAAGILVAVSLASSRDRLEPQHRGAVGLAAAAPLAIGALVAMGAIGGITSDQRNINVTPESPQFVFQGLLDNAPVLAADSPAGFCLPQECGTSTTHKWSFTYQQAEQVEYAFDNRDPTTPHNLKIFNVPPDQLDGLDSALSLSDVEANNQVITPGDPPDVAAGDAETYQWTPPSPDQPTTDAIEGGPIEVPQKAYFVCTIHPGTMWGVVTIEPGG